MNLDLAIKTADLVTFMITYLKLFQCRFLVLRFHSNVQCSERRDHQFVGLECCQFRSGGQRPMRSFGSCFYENPSPGYAVGDGVFGVPGVKHRRGSRDDEDCALMSMFIHFFSCCRSGTRSPSHPVPVRPSSPLQAQQTSLPPARQPSPNKIRQSRPPPVRHPNPPPSQPSKLRPPRLLSTFPRAPSISPPHVHHHRYRTPPFAFTAAVTAAFHEWNASFKNSDFFRTKAECVL